MKFICQACGAEIDDTMPKCPYCDTLIPKGAEKAYMEKLYGINEDMEELKEIPIQAVIEETKSQGKRIRKIIMITVIIVLVLAGIFMWSDKKYERDHTADYIWEEQNFPMMSELYEEGKYEELEEIYLKAWDEDRPVWNWEYHDEFSEWMEEQE